MRKYRLYRKDFRTYKDWITIIPTIEIHLDDPIYYHSNFSIVFSWLIFHARLLWKEDPEYDRKSIK